MTGTIGTLNKNFQFARAYRSKKSYVSPLAVTYIVPTKTGKIRVGITASKKIGCAVERNRARRVIRAASNELLKGVNGSCDIVFVCRAATGKHSSAQVRETLLAHLKSAGVLVD